ncbi:hypothetical protein [Pseudarthrobacter albicanus]|uniref:hypothetical protein n=1 Tax=Pseudarthrobacter albicanus TaxID=2823873 RepID=UPI001BAD292F|nr:hypothetical protein [Pseudarthrobacter albicanus]
MKRRSSAATTVPFALGGTRIQTVLPQLPELVRARANNPEAWDSLLRDDADIFPDFA